MNSEDWLSLKQIASELQIPERTLHYYKSQGDFPEIFKFGARHQRVRRADFERWVESRRKQ